jgi:hypothetical protein
VDKIDEGGIDRDISRLAYGQRLLGDHQDIERLPGSM